MIARSLPRDARLLPTFWRFLVHVALGAGEDRREPRVLEVATLLNRALDLPKLVLQVLELLLHLLQRRDHEIEQVRDRDRERHERDQLRSFMIFLARSGRQATSPDGSGGGPKQSGIAFTQL